MSPDKSKISHAFFILFFSPVLLDVLKTIGVTRLPSVTTLSSML